MFERANGLERLLPCDKSFALGLKRVIIAIKAFEPPHPATREVFLPMTHPLKLLCLSVLTASSLSGLASAQGFDHKAALPSQADVNAQFSSSADLERYRQQLGASQAARATQANQIAGLEHDIAGLSAQERSTKVQLERSNTQIADLDNQKRDVEAQIVDTRAKIADLESRISVTEARVARQRAAVNALLVRMYKDKSGEFVKLVSRAKSMHDLLLTAQYANKLSSADLELIATLKLTLEQLGAQRSDLVTLTDQLNGLQRQLIAKLDGLKVQRQNQQSAIVSLQQSKAGRSALKLETARAQQRTEAQMQVLVGNMAQERSRLEAARQDRLRALAAEKARRIEEARQIALEKVRLAKLAAEAEARRVAAENARVEQARIAQVKLEQARVEQARITQARVEAQRKLEAARTQERMVALRRDKEAALRLVVARRDEATRQAQVTQQANAAQDALNRANADQNAETRAANAQAEAARADEARLKREQGALEARAKLLETQQKQADREATQTQASLAVPSDYSGRLGFPMPGGRVSSSFNGSYVLISGGEGAAVQATGAGVVLQSSYYAAQGGVIVIQHSSGLQSLYFGLQSPTVSAGARVSSGQIIGYAGGSPSYGTDTMGYQVSVQTARGVSVAINPL